MPSNPKGGGHQELQSMEWCRQFEIVTVYTMTCGVASWL